MPRRTRLANAYIAQTTQGAAADAAKGFATDRAALPRGRNKNLSAMRPLRFEATPDWVLWNARQSEGERIALKALTPDGMHALWPLPLN